MWVPSPAHRAGSFPGTALGTDGDGADWGSPHLCGVMNFLSHNLSVAVPASGKESGLGPPATQHRCKHAARANTTREMAGFTYPSHTMWVNTTASAHRLCGLPGLFMLQASSAREYNSVGANPSRFLYLPPLGTLRQKRLDECQRALVFHCHPQRQT